MNTLMSIQFDFNSGFSNRERMSIIWDNIKKKVKVMEYDIAMKKLDIDELILKTKAYENDVDIYIDSETYLEFNLKLQDKRQSLSKDTLALERAESLLNFIEPLQPEH